MVSSSGLGGAYMGQYSGINNQTIEQLVQAESAPMLLMQRQVQQIQSKETAWGDIRSRLNNLLNKINTLQKPETFNSKVTNSSNDKVATISGDSTAAEGSHDLIVKQLATNSKITGARISDVKSSKDALNLTGTLKLALVKNNDDLKDSTGQPLVIPTDAASEGIDNKATLTLDITATDTISSIVDKINAQSKDTNIQASVVDNHLVIKSNLAGNYDINATSDDGLTSKLGLDQLKTTHGQAAIFSIDGLETARNSNTIAGVLDGATITLTGVSQKATNGDTADFQPTTIGLKNDDSKFQGAVNDFVSQYNSLMGLIKSDLSVGDPSKADNQTGSLAGDSDLIQLQAQLQRIVTPSSTGKGSATLSANSVGISLVDKEGTLGFDTTTFQKALKNNPQAVKDFFYSADIAPVTGAATNEKGYTTVLSKFANAYLSTSTGKAGIIATKTTSFDATIKDLNQQIDNFQDRLTAKRQQYVSQFSALDSFMMQAQAQLNYFTQQIGANTNNNNR
ncbi:flagellar filament capping protein FliD [Periweissella ghanensis]|uniref:Flagellar hook-associated protein 2 n=1 Tax=Periweissella ghanensis TaxID=467997 RepID=A0ABM8Z9T0_9LACO|nr:flagellar filament capping protein FliD [Periweissella ghanensis]MCM0600436.1 flagellar filament capping protein FliD [Periweissella ghanensis]CAH0418100.1 B-type flagellar hook-associated protein 2 [Periweissella ghanensis]